MRELPAVRPAARAGLVYVTSVQQWERNSHEAVRGRAGTTERPSCRADTLVCLHKPEHGYIVFASLLGFTVSELVASI